MKFSDDRIASLAHKIQEGLNRDLLVEYVDEDKALGEIKRGLIEYIRVEDEADASAREKIASLKREVAEGSREWEILYRKYLEEELNKKRR